MGKSLIIAEKPSVAADIARALGGFKKNGDFFENDQFVISSAIGHLVELAVPEGVELKRGKWNLENLPVLPGGHSTSSRSKRPRPASSSSKN